MRTESGPVVRRLDYRPSPYLIDRIDLRFDLEPEDTRVLSRMEVRRQADDPSTPLVLDADELELLAVRLNGRELAGDEYQVDERHLTLHPGRILSTSGHSAADRFELEVTTRLHPATNTQLMGLYVSGGNFYTQCEAEGFRRITYFLDRPDVMARYTVTLRGDRARYPVLLSNGNLVDQGDTVDGHPGWHWARWEDPFPKPSYLFALVAGNLVVREQRLNTASGREVLLQVWVEPGNEDKTEHAMGSLVNAIRWDERRFGLELDLDRFMIVAVGDFNMGAMENKGLNIFNTRYVFANPRIATDADFANVESVVGHEYFHNWTGNRVTCRDWFQLTLKEGLTVFRDQEFSADLIADAAPDSRAAASARAVKRIEDVRVLRASQFPEDAGPMAHPIRPDSFQEISNFYTVTVYEKGAEVIRMLQTLVGVEGFRRGMDLYFQRHDGQAVTCDDFVAAIADANGRALGLFGRWYSQSGTPRLAIEGHYDAQARRYRLDVRQSTPPTADQPQKQPLVVPLAVGLVGPDGTDLPLALPGGGSAGTRVLEVTEATQQFVFEGIDQAPVPSLGRNFSAPVTIDYGYDDRQLAFLAAHDSDPFNRWEASQRLAVRCMLELIEGADPEDCSQVLIDVYRRTLEDPLLDPAFKEQVFILPPEGFIAEQLAVVDPGAVRAARNGLRHLIGSRLQAAWQQAWQELAPAGPYQPDAVAAGRRALRGAALAYWCESGSTAAWEAAAGQYAGADNMTDRLAALQALINTPAPQRATVLARFAQDFADEPLVMDKWFSLQALAHRQPGGEPVVESVRKLLLHPAFSVKNPNKVRALVSGFCNGNLAEFHAADGSGYRFWTEQVLLIDSINPQVAARLARALDRWRKFTPDRQASMREALQAVASAPRLSADVNEIVTKALHSPNRSSR